MRIGNWTFIYFKDIAYNGILPRFRYFNRYSIFRLGVSIYFFKHVFRIDYSKRKIYYEYQKDESKVFRKLKVLERKIKK